jgi:hypothetical protein
MYLDNNFFSNAPFFAGYCYSEDDEIQVEFSGQEQYSRSQAASSLFFADGGGRVIGERSRINGEKKKKHFESRTQVFSKLLFFWCA